MTLESHLDRLRAKPERVRWHIAFWSSFGFTAVIFAFWLASFSVVGTKARQAVATTVDKAGTPAQSLTASVGSFFKDLKDLIFTPRRVVYSNIEVRPGKK